ncbi:MAG: protein kinase, partial [Myxococcaceae bacterium]|nr:protein kinase [Myxococcaceae bacterium]
MASTEQRIPTETFLLPGQQFCIGLPWERAAATQAPVASPPTPKAKPVVGNALDANAPVLQADPFEGVEIGKCRVLRRLSPGSARSLLAIREDDDDGVALVVLRRIDLPDVLGKDVQNNAVWASRFVHPNLARVFESELSDEGIFWVHELASGATLLEVTQACRKQGKGVPHGLVLASVYEAAKALAELHGPGFPHGLVSDQALALGFDGHCRLLDTGLFRCVANKSSWAEVAEPMGPYFALEQLTQGRMPDPKCDVFSLAVVLYEGLTGEKRRGDFDTRLAQLENGFAPPSRFSITLDKAIDEVVLRGLSKDRAVRYANAGEFAKALHTAASAFMWKKDQRSRFVRELFPARAFHEDGLMADCAQRAAARAARPKKLSFPLLRALSLTALPKLAPPPLPVAEAVA